MKNRDWQTRFIELHGAAFLTSTWRVMAWIILWAAFNHAAAMLLVSVGKSRVP